LKKIGLGQSLEILAHVGVLTGIIFLVIEINQNTAMIEAEMTQSRTESAMSEAQALYNSEYLPEIFVAIRKGEPLTDVQIERTRHWFRGFNRNLDNQLRQYQRGLLCDDILRSVDSAVRANAEAPIFREMWESTRLTFTDEYISFVDKIIAEIAEAEAPG
jgi:hypothetical protein